MAGGYSIDTFELKKLAADLRKSNPELLKQLSKAIRGAAVTVAVEARLLSGYYSARIPTTVRTFATGLNAGVRAGGARAPHAAPFEHFGLPGTFRHPVFGNRDNWVEQEAHPFLAPALEVEGPKVELAALAAVEATLLAAGFR